MILLQAMMAAPLIAGFIMIVGTSGLYIFLRIVNRIRMSADYKNTDVSARKLERIKTRRRDILLSFFINLAFCILLFCVMQFSGHWLK